MLSGHRKCNLIQNGGFEQGLTSWLGARNVGLSSPRCHEGLVAAAMGKPNSKSPATMFQDVRVCPGRSYRLQLSVAAAQPEGDPGDLEVQVLWVGPCAELEPAIGCDPLVIQGRTTCSWKTAVVYTGVVPFGVDTARICLTRFLGKPLQDCRDGCDEDPCDSDPCDVHLCDADPCGEDRCDDDPCEEDLFEQDSCEEHSCREDPCREDCCEERQRENCNYLLVDDVIFVERG